MSEVDVQSLLDDVLQALPKAEKVTSVEPAGTSAWTTTSSVTCVFVDEHTQKFFLKIASGASGHTILEGEYTATNAIHSAIPSLVPKIYAWGEAQKVPKTYYILSEYIPLTGDMPSPDQLAIRLADLHRTATSPNGMFGFSVPTCDGALPHRVAWKANWGDFYGELLRGVLEHDAEANGRWDELDQITEKVIDTVIPRLLGVLQDHGRNLQPSLIHGDLYEGNMGLHAETGQVMLWDASSFYAHNEMELGLWRWNETMRGYIDGYVKQFKKSEPEDEWDDRNRLYSVKTKLNMSADHEGKEGRAMRRVAYEDLCYLYEKFGDNHTQGADAEA